MNAHAQGMPCPNDGTPLVMSERQGIEIDYCPTCRGVWLDRGELDKIVERSAPPASAPAPQQAVPAYPQHHSGGGYYKQKRRKSFLEELFD
jgi:Zn-finger nucleic acid-binding protein